MEPTRGPPCCPRAPVLPSPVAEDGRAIPHSGMSAGTEGSLRAAGAQVRDLIQGEGLPGGGDMSTETCKRSRIWLHGEGQRAERIAYAEVRGVKGMAFRKGQRTVGLQRAGTRGGLQCRPQSHLS